MLGSSSMSAGKIANEFVRRGQASVRTCYESLRANNPSATGTLTLRFTVDTRGTVTEEHVDSFNPELITCVRAAMRSWTFEAPRAPSRFELVLDLLVG